AGTSNARGRTPKPSQVAHVPPDNPAASPYPVWQASDGYVAGYKVVWHRNIYQAKWFSQGSAPDEPAQGTSPNQWLLLGTMMAGTREEGTQRPGVIGQPRPGKPGRSGAHRA